MLHLYIICHDLQKSVTTNGGSYGIDADVLYINLMIFYYCRSSGEWNQWGKVLVSVRQFLAHLSVKLKRAFLIANCSFVNFSHLHLLLKNHLANLNKKWHKASLGKGV